MAEKQKPSPKGEIFFDPAEILFSGRSEPGRVAGIVQISFGLKNGADELAENADQVVAHYLLCKMQKKTGEMN